jgi:hypothetical protein
MHLLPQRTNEEMHLLICAYARAGARARVFFVCFVCFVCVCLYKHTHTHTPTHIHLHTHTHQEADAHKPLNSLIDDFKRGSAPLEAAKVVFLSLSLSLPLSLSLSLLWGQSLIDAQKFLYSHDM